MQETHHRYTTDGGSLDIGAAFVPEACIGFDITADYAHFRRVGNNSAKPSYRIPPRTTIAGLLAGIMGMSRDSYYNLFSPATSALAVVPKQMPHTYMMAITTVNTKADDASISPKRSTTQKLQKCSPPSRTSNMTDSEIHMKCSLTLSTGSTWL